MTPTSDSQGKETERLSVPGEASEADIAEGEQAWDADEREPRPVIPPDAPEADVLDQTRPAHLEDDDRAG